METEKYKTQIDFLSVGSTREPVFMGINMRLFFGNIVFCTLFCIDAHTWLGIPLFGIIYFLMLQFSIKEPNFAFIWFKVFTKTPPILNTLFWGKTNSYEPW